jgi:hypothetical protein
MFPTMVALPHRNVKNKNLVDINLWILCHKSIALHCVISIKN